MASNAWKNYYAAKREQESLSSAETITGVNGEQIKKVTTDDKGNLLTHCDGKYYSADGTEYKGSTKSNLYSQKSENWLDQKTDVYYEEVAKELEFSPGENPDDSFVNMITVDVDEYAKNHFEKSVKKTLSIPSWLNDIALKNGVNFSQILQEALMAKLNLK